MTKRCVFCGKPVKKKTKEHVIPEWLIEYTEMAEQPFYHYPLLDTNEMRYHYKNIPLNNFVFPACHDCNKEYGKLESIAKLALVALMEGQPINWVTISNIFDWFNRLRVGIWYAYMYLSKAPMDREWNNNANERIHAYDRALYIYKLDSDKKILDIVGQGHIWFQVMPNVFGLRINNFFFVSVSSISLLSKNLGFPFLRKMELGVDNFNYDLARGTQSITKPIIDFFIDWEDCVKFYQPLFVYEARELKPDYYKTHHVLENSYRQGFGKIFFNGQYDELNRLDENLLIKVGFSNVNEENESAFMGKMYELVLRFQKYDYLRTEDLLTIEDVNGVSDSLTEKEEFVRNAKTHSEAAILNLKSEVFDEVIKQSHEWMNKKYTET